MVDRQQKLHSLMEFLEISASASIDGHSSHDGYGCRGHSEAFAAKAEELLALIEEENYGYAPKLLMAHSIQPRMNYDRRDLRNFIFRLSQSELQQFSAVEGLDWFTVFSYDDGSQLTEVVSAEDFPQRQIDHSRELKHTVQGAFGVIQHRDSR